MAPLFPRSGPGESGSPMSQVILRCYDFPSRIHGRLFVSLPGSTLPSSVRVSQLALPEGRRVLSGPGSLFNRRPKLPAHFFLRGRERDLPGSQAIHPVPLPRSTTPAEPTIHRLFDGSVDAAPALPTARASALNEFRGSITRLWHLLPMLQDWCCHHPCKARFRLAGSPLPGGSRTLRIATKGFRSIAVSSSFSGFILAQGKFHSEPPFTSFDHLVGKGEQPIWNFKSKRLRSLKVDHQLELCGLHDRQVGGLLTL